ncbi:hypothetical protein H109_04301 [Trichophyton interdigitale MR816]|uniref:Uncharacterized protein n=1 Tax=Trichophyton interdigitale (strain MR816) TaxID=1215338 RepID=A0A059J8L3_TRIIM|nr:hypothetical protein H109_04301 [Trichophyton interdigitale MR816]
MPPQAMSYTPSYANDEHRRIAAAALRLSRLHPPGSVSSSGAPEPGADGAVRVPQAAYILDSGCVDVPVDIEVVDEDEDADAADADADADDDDDTDRDAEDWRRIKMLAAGSTTGSTEASQLRTDLLSHSHSLSHSRRSHQSHRSRPSQQSRRQDYHSEEDKHDDDNEEDDDDDDDDEEEEEEVDEDELEPGCSHENAFFVLLRISFYLPPFTIFAALYALISLIFLLLAIPLRLCPPSHFFKPPTSLTEQVCRLLVPLLRLNRKTITSSTNNHNRRRRRSSSSSRHHHNHHAKRSRRHYSAHSSLPASALTSPRQSYTISTSTPVSASFSSSTIPTQPVTATDSACIPASTTTPATATVTTTTTTASRLYPNYSAPMLVVVHLLSPLLLPPTLLAAWICACFWIFVMIMGNPDGKEKTDDGRAAVLAVRNWWCLWLASARRKRRKRDPEAGAV